MYVIMPDIFCLFERFSDLSKENTKTLVPYNSCAQFTWIYLLGTEYHDVYGDQTIPFGSSYHVGPVVQTQVVGLVASAFTHWVVSWALLVLFLFFFESRSCSVDRWASNLSCPSEYWVLPWCFFCFIFLLCGIFSVLLCVIFIICVFLLSFLNYKFLKTCNWCVFAYTLHGLFYVCFLTP